MNRQCDQAMLVVTPVYEDSAASSRLFRELADTFQRQVYIVAVDDGSVREPLTTAGISDAGLDGVILRLKRNVGHQRAIAIGLNYLVDRAGPNQQIVVMDADGEDMPESIRQLSRLLVMPTVDVVVAQRKNRAESAGFRASYLGYKWLFKLLTGKAIGFGNFMVMKPSALVRLTAMQELSIHVAACVLTSKLRVVACPLRRGQRYAGQSRMNFVSLVLHGFKALMVFAEDVLVRVSIACALIAGLSVIGVATAVALKLMGFATPGWFSVSLGIMLLVFLQTGTLTLMTLMLSGVVRSGSVATVSYREFIGEEIHVSSDRGG